MKESGGDRMLAQNLPAMAAPSSSAPEPTADTVTPPRPSSSAGGNPSKPFRSNATNTPVIRPPIFPPQPLLGKPLNPSAAPSPSHGVLYPVGATAHRGFNVRSAGGGRSTDQLVSVANPAGYLRSSSPMAVMNFAAAVAAASQARPYVYGGADHAMAVAALAHGMRPPPPQGQQQSYQSAVPRPGPPRGASLPAKVVSVPVNPLVPELSDTKERDKGGEDAFVMIHGRKVRLADGGLGSLYALCRSWMRSGPTQETHPSMGDGIKLLPKPLPRSIVEEMSKKEGNKGDEVDEHDDSVEQVSSHDILKRHIKRAKRVRARLRRERLLKIERYKQRLSLLLPAPNDLGQTNGTPGSS